MYAYKKKMSLVFFILVIQREAETHLCGQRVNYCLYVEKNM